MEGICDQAEDKIVPGYVCVESFVVPISREVRMCVLYILVVASGQS
jgi:hypothetical protein